MIKHSTYCFLAIVLIAFGSLTTFPLVHADDELPETDVDVFDNDGQYGKVEFTGADILLQGNWLYQLGQDTITQANTIMQIAPNQSELAQVIAENGNEITEMGNYLIKNKDAVTATESIQMTGDSLKKFGESLFLASDIMRYLELGNQTEIIDKLSAIGESLQTAAQGLYEVGYEGYLNGGNINIAEYEAQLQNVTILYESYRALKRGTQQQTQIEAKITSSKAEKNSNNTYQVIYFDGTDSIDPFGTIDTDNGYFWDFGDGTFSTGAYVSHRYIEPGKYVVKLMVNGDSGFDLTTTEVKIDAVYPVAIISTDKESPIGPNPEQLTLYADEPIQFSASGSFDPGGKTEDLEYSWDFGDGNRNSSEDNMHVSHAYTKPGEYEVALEARIDKLSDVSFKKITVLPHPPKATFNIRKEDNKYWDSLKKDYYSDHLGDTLSLEFDASASLGAPLNDAQTQFSQLIEYDWSFGDGERETQKISSIKSGETITHTYEESGIFVVTLTVKDINGQEGNYSKTIYISEVVEPVAEMEIRPESDHTTQSSIQLDGSGSRSLEGNIQQYVWEIRNADKETVASFDEEVVSFNPERPGTYELRLYVINSQGVESPNIKQTINVASAPPVASFDMNFVEDSVNEIELDASLSTDPDPDDYLTYSWDFDSDGDFEINRIAQPKIKRIFDQIGQNEVTLQVTDSSGQTDTYSQVINIESTLMARLSTVNTPSVGHAPLTVTLQAQGFYNLLEGFDYSTIKRIEWDFDDGTDTFTDTNLSNGKSIQKHVFEEPGRYQVHIDIYDSKGKSAEAYYSIHVGDGVNPIPAIDASPASLTGTVNTTFSFDATESVNGDGTMSDLGYSWNFGDLSTIETDAVVEHSYKETGRFVVTLTLTDYEAQKVSKQSITVVVSDAPTVANFIASPRIANVKSVVRFDASSSFDSDNEIVEYRWDFGDGNIIRTPNAKVNHIYTEKGEYTVTVIVENNAGVQTESNDVIITVK